MPINFEPGFRHLTGALSHTPYRWRRGLFSFIHSPGRRQVLMEHETAYLLGVIHECCFLLSSLRNMTELHSEMASYGIRVLFLLRKQKLQQKTFVFCFYFCCHLTLRRPYNFSVLPFFHWNCD